MGWSITDLTVSTTCTRRPSSLLRDEQISRWWTTEFYVYYVIMAASLLHMVQTVVNFSSENHPKYHEYAHKLHDGWLGRRMDLTDAQYSQFRAGLIPLVAVVSLYLFASQLFQRFISRPERRITWFILPASLTFVFVLHGSSTLKVLGLLSVNFIFAHLFASIPYLGPGVGWVFNVSLLVTNKYFEGYTLGTMHPQLEAVERQLFQGLMPRWHIAFNISILRMISYFMDLHACRQKERSSSVTAEKEPLPKISNRLSSADFTFAGYLAYVLYPPLFIAGPIMTFTSFINQIRTPPESMTARSLALYGLRFLFCLFTLELVLSFMYVVAIKDSRVWASYTANQLFQLGFWNLIVIWLKLLLPWRFFRLWALCDGVDPPENMVRCMANNYSVTGFWRSWHRSYNLWVINYIYIPLGGKNHAVPATVVVFTFVATWHDISLKLLKWGWVAALIIMPELLAKRFVPADEYSDRPWYRHLAAAGGVLNIVLLMSANLIGFALGWDGMLYMLKLASDSTTGLATLGTSCVAVFSAVQMMFEYREQELRVNVDRRC